MRALFIRKAGVDIKGSATKQSSHLNRDPSKLMMKYYDTYPLKS